MTTETTTHISHQTIAARELREGDLMQIGTGTTYVLVADAERTEAGIVVTLYDGNGVPDDGPYKTFPPSTKVRLSMRNASPVAGA
jgi:tRNA A37 threonylcarbamoyladenosine synthetase subunit TsaC/SUA5/YrdC